MDVKFRQPPMFPEKGDYLYQIIPREDANSYREEDQLPLLPKVLAKEGVQ